MSLDDGNSLVTVLTCADPMEAMFARSLLESAGIDVHISDEVMGSLYPPMLTGGIHLQVSAADEESAREILSQPAPPDDATH
jgi:hypothetical protein